MAMIKLPINIQSLFCSSTHLNTYKRAIEELVCNSLDAESTSIAIRCHIDENTIQVIDNGYGVAHCDFPLLGQRYATSKCVDMSTLKSAPNKYGFRGESLASIIQASKSVKIISRNGNTEETWEKTFYKGKEHSLSETAPRPSIGTTVEIKGFLYNLNIQKKAINTMDEINEIKSFLEQLSLVHSSISISLRDDSKNEIIFKLHKNRDIYQTLSSVFGVENSDVQELKVEKNEYKVTGIIGKQDKDNSQCHWIYLNGKFVHTSKLHRAIDDTMVKSLGLKYQTKRRCKSKNYYNEAEDVSRNKIPFYFIFITCPYYDYDISNTTKHTSLEFKNWEQIYRLLEKLVKFYVGDINMKINPVIKKIIKNQDEKNDYTRDKVNKLIQNILGSSKKPGISQMHKGIKGKLIKRKNKTKKNNTLTKGIPPKDNDNINDAQRTSEERVSPLSRNTVKKTLNISLSKIIPPKRNTNHNHYEAKESFEKRAVHPEARSKEYVVDFDLFNLKEVPKIIKITKTKKKPRKTKILHANGHSEVEKTSQKGRNDVDSNGSINNVSINLNQKKVKKVLKNNAEKSNIAKPKVLRTVCTAKKKKGKNATNTRRNKHTMIDSLILKFEKRDSVKKRCNVLGKKVDKLMSYKKKRKRNIFINEAVQYSNVIRNNKNVSIRKQVNEIVIHDYIPLPPKFYPCSKDKRVWDGLTNNYCKSSYDLVRTIIKSQQEINTPAENFIEESNLTCVSNSKSEASQENDNVELLPKLTFESHKYQDRNSHSPNPTSKNIFANYARKDIKRFITKQSRENFILPQDERLKKKIKTEFRKPFNFKTNTPYERKETVFNFNTSQEKIRHLVESSYTIEHSQINENVVQKENNENIIRHEQVPFHLKSDYDEIGMTYKVGMNDDYVLHNSRIDSTYTVFSKSLRMIDDNYENRAGSNEADDYESKRTYSIQDSNNSCYCSGRIQNEICDNSENLQELDDVLNVVFVSKSQEDNNEMFIDSTCSDPLIICETEFQNIELVEGGLELNYQMQDESWCNDVFDVSSLTCIRNDNINTPQASCQVMNTHKSMENYSHHFNGFQKSGHLLNEPRNNEAIVLENNDRVKDPITIKDLIENNADIEPSPRCSKDLSLRNDNIQTIVEIMNPFILKDRLRFVPKGMSQIFDNCQPKTVRDYNCQEEYYEQTIYDKFANNVQAKSKIFEPRIQNVKELASRDIEKVYVRLNKENASLTFNGDSLKQANILCQVDDKFIAAKMKGTSGHLMNEAEYLILFDQHAVHERIRLENNLADYLSDNQWKSVTLDDISLKLTKEAVLYLHNYKDKFAQFGLQWTILNDSEITVSGIPKAILGKNPRQAELVIKAVKNLISEEINAMKLQRGCIALYPKAIMDLVFSESCRYAIKFGDKLSKTDCGNLLSSLSECKTPFQCAHGRPVMAVVMEVKSEKREYKINKTKIYQFMRFIKKTK